MSTIVFMMVRNLILTILLVGFAAFLMKFRKEDLILVALVNLLTNPPVVAVIFTATVYKGYEGWLIATIIMEAFALVTEWLIYGKLLKKRKPGPFMLSLLLNCISYFSGVILQSVFRL